MEAFPDLQVKSPVRALTRVAHPLCSMIVADTPRLFVTSFGLMPVLPSRLKFSDDAANRNYVYIKGFNIYMLFILFLNASYKPVFNHANLIFRSAHQCMHT